MVDTSVQYQNLAGVPAYFQDGNLVTTTTNSAPTAVIVGTSGQGIGNTFYLVSSTTDAKIQFGTEGTLLRGMWEAKSNGAEQVALYRIGCASAKVEHIGDSNGVYGYTVETYRQDADAGGYYSLYYDDAEDRLVIKRESDDLIVFDNDTTNPIDLGEVVVSGYRAAAGGPDIGSPSSFVTLESVDPSTYAGTSYTAGTDGLNLSRMELYEELYNAYENLKTSNFDVIIPMDVYLDDYNTVNQGHQLGAVAPESNSGSNDTYPTSDSYKPGLDVDSLGMVYVEEYLGEYYFWWRFGTSGNTANVFPSVGSASATTKIDGTDLTADDFHEVNFAYQMGRFLYEYSTNIVNATGVIGVLPPASDSLADKAKWYGKAPEWTYDSANGVYYIANIGDNGSGLLGNKFMVGMSTHRSGLFGGGFIATDGKFMDSGSEIKDDNDVPVDLGKYFSIVADHPLIRNGYSSISYPISFAASYGGFYIGMNPGSAPTNKSVYNTRIVYKVGLRVLDDLAGAGYVVLREKSTGLKIADAPTATLPSSDWRRLSTVRIVKAVVDGIRNAVDAYLGEGMSDGTRAAMKNSVEKILLAAKKAGYLQDYKPFEIIQTPSMEIEGKAEIELTLIPAYELRQVTLSVSLSKSS